MILALYKNKICILNFIFVHEIYPAYKKLKHLQ